LTNNKMSLRRVLHAAPLLPGALLARNNQTNTLKSLQSHPPLPRKSSIVLSKFSESELARAVEELDQSTTTTTAAASTTTTINSSNVSTVSNIVSPSPAKKQLPALPTKRSKALPAVPTTKESNALSVNVDVHDPFSELPPSQLPDLPEDDNRPLSSVFLQAPLPDTPAAATAATNAAVVAVVFDDASSSVAAPASPSRVQQVSGPRMVRPLFGVSLAACLDASDSLPVVMVRLVKRLARASVHAFDPMSERDAKLVALWRVRMEHPPFASPPNDNTSQEPSEVCMCGNLAPSIAAGALLPADADGKCALHGTRAHTLSSDRLCALLLMTWIAEVLGSVICEPAASALVSIVADASAPRGGATITPAFRETLLVAFSALDELHILVCKYLLQLLASVAKRAANEHVAMERLAAAFVALTPSSSGTLEARQRLVVLLTRLHAKVFVVIDGKRRRPALSLMSANPLLSWPQHAANVPPSPDAHAPFSSLTRWIPFVVDGDTFDGVRQRVLAAVALLSKPAALASFGLFESGATAHPVDIQSALDMLHLAPNSVVLLSTSGAAAAAAADEVAVSAPALSCALLILVNAPNGRLMESSALVAALQRSGAARSGVEVCREVVATLTSSARAIVRAVFGLLHQLLEAKQRTSNRLDRLQVLHAWARVCMLEPTLSMDGAAERLRQIYPLLTAFVEATPSEIFVEQ
jgi:hypothetical protein